MHVFYEPKKNKTHFFSKNRNTDLTLLVDARVINLGGERDLCGVYT
jgi:hypothetical protein